MEVVYPRRPVGAVQRMDNGSSPLHSAHPFSGFFIWCFLLHPNQRLHGCASHIHGGCPQAACGTVAERAQWAKQRGEAWRIARSDETSRLCEFFGGFQAGGQRFESSYTRSTLINWILICFCLALNPNPRLQRCSKDIDGGCLSAAPSGTEAECALWAKQRGEASETERSGTRLFRFPDRNTADRQRFE